MPQCRANLPAFLSGVPGILARLLGTLVAALLLSGSLHGSEDLGEGLKYLRLAQIPGDLPPSRGASEQGTALVIDLRGTKTDASGAGLLSAWLAFQCTPGKPTFLLLNGDTDAHILRGLKNASTLPGLLTLAPANTVPDSDLGVSTSVELDREACTRLSLGAPPGSLIDLSVGKERQDEAKLTMEYGSGLRLRHRERPPASETEAPDTTQASDTIKPAKDHVLARAVHVHLSLRALRSK